MKALPPSSRSLPLASTWFDGTPVGPGLQLLPSSQRFDPRRLSVRRLLRRMPGTSCRAVQFDAGWDRLALALDHELSLLHPDYTISAASAQWAELRIVTSVDDDPAARRLLREAAGESMERCERCGEPGRPVRCMPRQRTLCPGHAAEHRFDEAIRVTVEQLRAAEQRSA